MNSEIKTHKGWGAFYLTASPAPMPPLSSSYHLWTCHISGKRKPSKILRSVTGNSHLLLTTGTPASRPCPRITARNMSKHPTEPLFLLRGSTKQEGVAVGESEDMETHCFVQDLKEEQGRHRSVLPAHSLTRLLSHEEKANQRTSETFSQGQSKVRRVGPQAANDSLHSKPPP